MDKAAILSKCGRYRYYLSRRWDNGQLLTFMMLNPSTADAEVDDPTITRCCERALRLGYGGMIVLNLFAYRATDPAVLRKADDPVGIANDEMISAVLDPGAEVICAWGTGGGFLRRDRMVINVMWQNDCRLFHLGLTKNGHPKHPLYQPYSQPLIPWKEMT